VYDDKCETKSEAKRSAWEAHEAQHIHACAVRCFKRYAQRIQRRSACTHEMIFMNREFEKELRIRMTKKATQSYGCWRFK